MIRAMMRRPFLWLTVTVILWLISMAVTFDKIIKPFLTANGVKGL